MGRSDESQVRRDHKAEEEAVRALHAQHGRALLAYAHRRLPDSRDAEEVVQEVLVRAWRYSSSYDPDRGSERGWLFGIARNVITDRITKTNLRVVGSPHEAGELDNSLERLIDASVIADALDRLSVAHRSAIVAAYYQGKTTTQIADDTGVAAGTVKSRIFYGLRALRDSLEEQGIIQ